jgi:transcription-repair coupling factor (superfamily II helicase)
MDLSPLLSGLRSLEPYDRLRAALLEMGAAPAALPLNRSVRPMLAAALALDTRRPVLFLAPRADRLLTVADEVAAWAPGIRLLTLPTPNPLFYDQAPWGPRTIHGRAAVLACMIEDRQPGRSPGGATPPTIYLATAHAVMTRTISPRQFLANSPALIPGASQRMDKLVENLLGWGYEPQTLVAYPGEFSRRGGILDLWPPAEPLPCRIEFFGDDIESLRQFEPATQRSKQSTHRLRLTPAREGMPKLLPDPWPELAGQGQLAEGPGQDAMLEYYLPWMNPAQNGALDFLPPAAIVLQDDAAGFAEAVDELEEQALRTRQDLVAKADLPADQPLPYLTLAELREALDSRTAIDLGMTGGREDAALELGSAFEPGPRFGGQLRPLMEYLLDRHIEGASVIVVSRQAPRLGELWSEVDPEYQASRLLPDPMPPGEFAIVHGALAEGWILRLPDGTPIHLLSDAEIFGWARPRPRRPLVSLPPAPESAYADLTPGDFVVHVEHGIGRFNGLVDRVLDGFKREFLLIEYAEGDQLYVPIHQADRVSRYLGPDGALPALSRLGTQDWEHTRGRVEEAVEEVARDLLDLYARRMTVAGHAFSPDSTWQHELESSFAYVETDDQIKAIEAVKADMERPQPMDRLICGDVGYGKTEVALRAAFKAVMDGKQVVMLVPTTVLAQQHFNTFCQRLAPFPVVVEMLSRFRTRSQAEAVLKGLAAGEVDIVIGTHRLLQRDVQVPNLGLLIIDEEQRFGVTHKEFLKRMRTEVDVLTMTATPIPRTLYMALTGVRDISTINTPPEERLPVITHVGPYEPRLVRQAILREINRGGQVFFVHNRVETIEAAQQRLARLVPEAETAIGHGQMPEADLAGVMERFARGDLDVLVSTSIIESGLDIPNANTLIVDRADTFGLSQLYQLRGRVGRGASRAYAYFFRPPQKRAKEDALQRLEIIAEHSQLGSGYAIAMRDLEMRGTGDILGTRQHGHIAAVGFHLYTRLLAQAVQRLKPESRAMLQSQLPSSAEPLLVTVDLPLPSVIPSDYIGDRELRLRLYRRMAELRSIGEIEVLASELDDRFGPPPDEVVNLLLQLRLKVVAARAGVKSITLEGGQILLQLSSQADEQSIENLHPAIRLSKRGIWLGRQAGDSWLEELEELLRRLANAIPAPSVADAR